MEKLQVYLLKETLGIVPEKWGVKEYATFHYSDVMKSLYLKDFPNAWEQEDLKNKLSTIGANDYFNKWTGDNFLYIEDTELNFLLDYVKPSLAEGSTIAGKKTGIPLFGGNHQLLFYNKKYVSDEPKTMDELIVTADEVKKQFNLDYGFVLPTGACYFILPFLYGFGAPLWADKGEPIPFDALVKTIELLRVLIYDKKSLPIKWEQAESIKCFTEEKAAYCIGGDWNIREFDEATNHNLGICEIPALDRCCRSTANASYLFLSRYLEPELYSNVKEMCKIFFSIDVQTEIMKNLYRMPAIKDYDMNAVEISDLLRSSYSVYESAYILPAKKEVTHMYHVLADMLEPYVIAHDSPEDIARKVMLHLEDVESYYKNNLLKKLRG